MAASWRRVRFLIYLAVATLVYQCLTTLRRAPVTPALPLEPKLPDQDLPWYRSPHPQPPSRNANYSTVDLETAERLVLETEAVHRARQVAEALLGPVKEIRGSTKDATTIRDTVNCWTTGRWVKGDDGYHVPMHFMDPLYGKCRSEDRLHYRWETNCPLQDIEASKWCTALAGRNILLVGDLVQYQMHEVLLDAIRDGPTVCFGELNCKDHTLCSQPTSRMRYLRNDVLSTVRRIDQANGHPSVDIVQWPFTTGSILKAYSVFILNRSPVVEDDETFIQELVKTMRTIRNAAPDALILYRSSSIGHPYCNDATGPLDSPLADSELRKLPYGWSELHRRNAMARVIVEAAGGVFVDLAALTDVRPDGHVGGQDCLRYCIPGPLDQWAQILYNLIVEL
ncbi:hypothetical protein BJV82DRAFT_529966 [Fennellomyces sp. T-0311]|nr:hypothetical protein BJV82DRAFT_529966 [Fennellomyces sp. T-0311]